MLRSDRSMGSSALTLVSFPPGSDRKSLARIVHVAFTRRARVVYSVEIDWESYKLSHQFSNISDLQSGRLSSYQGYYSPKSGELDN